jgi:pimeloyl-ACP methyl ester carboxylesterase
MTRTDIHSSDGTRLAATRSGEGPPLVLVHGGTGNQRNFEMVRPVLEPQHTVWTYDRRGYGGSEDGRHDLRSEVADMHAVLEAADQGEGVHLVAHSYGSVVALHAAADRPPLTLTAYEPPLRVDRVRALIDRVLALIEANRRAEAVEVFLTGVGVDAAQVSFLQSVPEIWQPIVEGARHLPRESRVLREEVDLDRLPDVPAPLQFLIGEHTSSAVYASPDELRERFPGAEIRVLPGQDHLGFAFDPDGFAEAVLALTTSRSAPCR